MLDADPARLTKHGTITIEPDGRICVDGFEGKGASCRDVAALAMAWAIGVLAEDLRQTMERPGGGRSSVN